MKGSLADAVARHEVEKKQLLGRLEDELGKKDEVVRRLEREIAEIKGFKYTEPVRKKADREDLKGVECKQCKKFYDAVLPDGRANGDGANSTSMRCEHQDGVSRHRYRYAPPLTPEGFWNIGFESEM
uniref:DNA endonuclease activator Ctp1 C-terminal domain-containing protein n=1 Tax=Oryza brachyantha TaxID=4533 RepID=J3MFT9_ORYBR